MTIGWIDGFGGSTPWTVNGFVNFWSRIYTASSGY